MTRIINNIKTYISRCIRFILLGQPKVYANISQLAPNSLLKGKNVIITGGGRGIGASMAKKFVREGANVLIAGRDKEVLYQTAKDAGCKWLQLNITELDSFDSFISNAEDLIGPINCLVNNAGISLHENSLFDVSEDTFDRQFNTNLKGAYFLSQRIIKKMLDEERYGNILFISSETGDTMDYRPYGISKAAINSMVQGFAYLLAEKNIRVNAVAPGVTASNMTGFKTDGDLYCGYNINKRVYLPEEVAEVACFLLSDISGCISGQIVTCNNGKTINARWK